MEIKMALYLPRDAASVPVTRRVLDRCLETLGVTPDTRADIALALSEACANVVLHAGPGEEYQVQASARSGQCVIEVVNAGSGTGTGHERPGRSALAGDPVPATAEHGRGLRIIDGVADSRQLTRNERHGVTVRCEEMVQGMRGAAGEDRASADAGS